MSMLGDQFFSVALPWLVPRLTGDPLALGFMLALAGIPLAAFTLRGCGHRSVLGAFGDAGFRYRRFLLSGPLLSFVDLLVLGLGIGYFAIICIT